MSEIIAYICLAIVLFEVGRRGTSYLLDRFGSEKVKFSYVRRDGRIGEFVIDLKDDPGLKKVLDDTVNKARQNRHNNETKGAK